MKFYFIHNFLGLRGQRPTFYTHQIQSQFEVFTNIEKKLISLFMQCSHSLHHYRPCLFSVSSRTMGGETNNLVRSNFLSLSLFQAKMMSQPTKPPRRSFSIFLSNEQLQKLTN